MRYSEDEVEKNIGIEVFLTNTNGIGGKLRASPEDFYVEEIPIYPKKEEGGKYAVAKVISKNWEANKLLNILSTTLKISRRKIYFAGTKDKRAIKSQLMVFEVDKEKLSAVKIKDIEIIPLYTTNKKIRIGELIGNNFDVTIRDLDNPAIAEDRMIEITNEIMASNGFPNF
ncbi:MAG: tRNA pseudouridine(13) synthase TruD, partial [Candidatus Thermoplasmatota archaeon]